MGIWSYVTGLWANLKQRWNNYWYPPSDTPPPPPPKSWIYEDASRRNYEGPLTDDEIRQKAIHDRIFRDDVDVEPADRSAFASRIQPF